MPVPKSILVIDDHPIVRSGLRMMIENIADYKIIGEAGNAKEGFRLAKELKPDIAIVDIRMPDMDGITLTKELLKHLKNTRIVIISAHERLEYVRSSMNAGAIGYMVKGSDSETLYKCLDFATQGKRFIDPSLSDKLYDCIGLSEIPVNQAEDYNGKYRSLTPREKEILRLVLQDISLADISKRLSISYKTVANHKSNVMKKFGFEKPKDMIRYFNQLTY